MTDQTISQVSTVSGHVLSALSGYIATSLIPSMDSLRREGGYLGRGGEKADGSASAVENVGAGPVFAESSALLSHQSTNAVSHRPLSGDAPRSFSTSYLLLFLPLLDITPLSRPPAVPNSPPQYLRATNMSPQSSVPRTMSLNLGHAPPNRPDHISPLERSASTGTSMAVSPPPVPPVPTQWSPIPMQRAMTFQPTTPKHFLFSIQMLFYYFISLFSWHPSYHRGPYPVCSSFAHSSPFRHM